MDLEQFKKGIEMLRNQPPAPILIEVYPLGYEMIRNSIDNTNKAILSSYNMLYGAKLVVISDSKEFKDFQARVTYGDGKVKVLDILKERIFVFGED